MLLVCLIPTAAVIAQETKEPGVAPLDIGEQVLEPGSSNYPAELAATGAQGTVTTRSKIDPDGRLVDAQVVVSSKSSQLDELAIGYANKLRIKAPADAKGAQEALLQVTFSRDTTFTILKKSCAEFNTDLAFARGLDPAATASNLRGYKLAQGIVMFAKNRGPKEVAAMAKNFKTAPAAIESACVAQPDANLAATLEGVITAK
jgi:TonB family protein